MEKRSPVLAERTTAVRIPLTTRHYSNAFRYAQSARWLELYDCRVLLPERGLWFFIKPYILMGTELPPEARRLCLYEGGNGSPGSEPRGGWEPVAAEWSASRERCDVRWTRGGAAQLFDERHIRASGPLSTWDVTIEPFLADQKPEETNLHRLDLGERLLLERMPLVHRVPRMRAYASGTIVQEGRRHSFERAIAVQAKNHGPAFPDEWITIHAAALREVDALAIELSWMRHAGGSVATARISTPAGVRFLATWNGDDVEVRHDGDTYTFHGITRDGSLEIRGAGTPRESVVVSFPTPDGQPFENDECVGELKLTLAGRHFTSGMALLSHGRGLSLRLRLTP